MKQYKLILTLMLGVFLLNSCAQEEDIVTSGSYPDGTIRFRLGGSAALPRATRSTAEANESEVNSVLALLWNREDTSDYSVVECKPTGGDNEWSFKVEKDAQYYIQFIANADEETRQTLINLPRTESGMYNSATCNNLTREAITTQSPEGENFLMVSSSMVNTNTSVVTGVLDLGTITFNRRSARFDIVNKADDITINKINFNNRTIKSNISVPNTWASEDSWYEDTVYNNLNIVGSSEEGSAGEYRHQIYSYRNYSTEDNGKLPSLTIEYTETKDGNSVTRQHTVEFLDPESEGKIPLRIMDNRLYTVTLTKAHKMNFEVSVSDWEAGEEFIGNNLSLNDLNIDSEEQQRLNSLLMVNRFTEYNVKNLNMTDKTVELYDRLSLDPTDYISTTDGTGPYFRYSDLKNAGLFDHSSESSIIKDKDGTKYRIPTAGEAMLLLPAPQSVFYQDINPKTYINSNGEESNLNPFIRLHASSKVYSSTLCDLNYEEKVVFNDKLSGNNFIMGDIKNPSDGFSSTLNAVISNINPDSICISKDGSLRLVNESEEQSTKYYIQKGYAVRFEGTSEYAAYKWEYVKDPSNSSQAYGSVKIKALPNKLKVSVYDIVDNDAYWDKDYIEYKFPAIGMYAITTKEVGSTSAPVFAVSTLCCYAKKYLKVSDLWRPCAARFSYDYFGLVDYVENRWAVPLRLIKVEDTATAPAE